MEELLQIEDLSVEFEAVEDELAKRVVDRIQISLREGEAICLVGESGCGKTVTALAIMGLLPRSARPLLTGKILFKKQDLLSLKEGVLRGLRGKEISMIFQEPMTSLNPVLTIGEQLKEIFKAHRQGMGQDPHNTERSIEERCVQLLGQVKLPHPEAIMKAYPHMLSGGQRQRVMIAMAVALKPSLIIADEPTTALDVTLQWEILGLLKELQGENKSSLIFITHDLSLVPYVGDRIYVMYMGKIMEEGPVDEVIINPMHPYTRDLIRAIPDPRKKGKGLSVTRREAWDGRVGDGCRYFPICTEAMERCRSYEPYHVGIGPRKVRCHLYGDRGNGSRS
ncbi:MAG: ABC transporter ATP-binding protein [Desulfatiglandales bacterium]